MRTLYIVVILIAVTFGCRRQAEQPPETVETARSESQELYLGHPLAHWVRLAERGPADDELEKALDALVLAIEGGDPTAVVAAADAAGVIGPRAARTASALASKLDVPEPWVRMACMHALQAIGEPAVPVLLEVFRSSSGGVQVRVVNVLGEIGPGAQAAVPTLRTALEEGPESLRSWVEEALAQIEGIATPGAMDGSAQDEQVVLPAGPPATAGRQDWPRFRGPFADNICRETGLRTDWSRNPPTLLWKIEGLGTGYSSVAVTGGRIFTMGDRQGTDGSKAQFVLAYDLETQKELWATKVGPGHEDGPRCIPTVDGDFLYAIGTEGDLVCLETATGAERWRKSLAKDFGGVMMSGWKFSESVLVDGARVICTPGGPEATLVALDKETGEVLWKCAAPALGEKGRDGAGYASVVVAEIDGVRQYVQLIGRGLVAAGAETGRFLWGYNDIANRVANIPTPVVLGRYVFTTTNYNTGSALLRISRKEDAFHVEELYTLSARQFENHHGGIVCVGSHVYGGHGNSRGEPVCVDVATGEIAWRGTAPERGSAAVLYADGHLWFRYDRGLVALIEATPEAFRLKGTFQAVTGDGPAWAYPVIAGGRLYLRHGNLLACYDVRDQ